jgi:uncharacterized protein YecE (DUF72 family)
VAIDNIRIGTCNWSDHQNFYPAGLPPGDRLAFYARFFDIVEIDSTYYHLMPARNFDRWASITPPDFVFDVKAFRQLTKHDRDTEPEAATFETFGRSIDPLRQSGKLRAILFQFPPWFTATDENRDYLASLQEFFPDDTVAVEFRHRSWLEDDEAPRTLELLRENGLAYAMVDEPQIGSGSVPPIQAVTSPEVAIARFHGRNYQTWYKKVQSTGERFNYLYTREELAPWAESLRELAPQTREVHVLLNNNANNYAVLNARDFMALFSGADNVEGAQLSFLADPRVGA